MNNCSICFENIQLINSCNECAFCKNCFTTYISLQIQQGIEAIPCPQCRQILNSDFIENEVEQKELNEAKFYYYLKIQQDIRSCPKEGCPYKGFIIFKPCSENLECLVCQAEWKDKDLIKSELSTFIMDKIYEFNFIEKFQEIQSNICQELISNKCPYCQVPIVKSEGCSHITCIKCKYEFCWYCLKKYQNHQIYTCFHNYIIKSLINLTIIYNILIAFNLCQFLFGIISIIGNFILKQIAFNIIYFINFFILSKIQNKSEIALNYQIKFCFLNFYQCCFKFHFYLKLDNLKNNYRWNTQFKTEFCIVLMILQFVGYYQMGYIYILVLNLIPEFIFLCIIIIILQTKNFLWRNWIKYVE